MCRPVLYFYLTSSRRMNISPNVPNPLPFCNTFFISLISQSLTSHFLLIHYPLLIIKHSILFHNESSLLTISGGFRQIPCKDCYGSWQAVAEISRAAYKVLLGHNQYVYAVCQGLGTTPYILTVANLPVPNLLIKYPAII